MYQINSLSHELGRRLKEFRTDGLYRSLSRPEGEDFSSNDYLGLSRDPRIRRSLIQRLESEPGSNPISTPSSRLLRGTTAEHQDLEKKLACFKGTEDSLIFPTGYQANLGLLPTLIGRRDRVLSDQLNHASIIDGIRLSRGHKIVYPHRDVEAIRKTLSIPHSSGRTFLVTESLFSMDGDIAPLDRYADLADEWGADLIVDDSHATGIFGSQRGSGLTEHFGVEGRTVAIVSGCGKSLGLAGAFVSAPKVIIEYLVNACRSFGFTTSTPPLLLYVLEKALEIIQEEPWRRQHVLELSNRLRRHLRSQGLDTMESSGPIIPVILGDNLRALSVSRQLQRRGLDVRAIRPPTVPVGTARLRISLHAGQTSEQVDRLSRALSEVLEHD